MLIYNPGENQLYSDQYDQNKISQTTVNGTVIKTDPDGEVTTNQYMDYTTDYVYDGTKISETTVNGTVVTTDPDGKVTANEYEKLLSEKSSALALIILFYNQSY